MWRCRRHTMVRWGAWWSPLAWISMTTARSRPSANGKKEGNDDESASVSALHGGVRRIQLGCFRPGLALEAPAHDHSLSGGRGDRHPRPVDQPEAFADARPA